MEATMIDFRNRKADIQKEVALLNAVELKPA